MNHQRPDWVTCLSARHAHFQTSNGIFPGLREPCWEIHRVFEMAHVRPAFQSYPSDWTLKSKRFLVLATATYLDRKSPHGFLKKCFPTWIWCASLVEDNPAAVQRPTTDQPNNRRMLLGKWIGEEILINGCNKSPFTLVVRIWGKSRNIINLVVHY